MYINKSKAKAIEALATSMAVHSDDAQRAYFNTFISTAIGVALDQRAASELQGVYWMLSVLQVEARKANDFSLTGHWYYIQEQIQKATNTEAEAYS